MNEGRNELGKTVAQRIVMVDASAGAQPSRGYRWELAPLLRSCVTLEADRWSRKNGIVDGIPCIYILLRDAKVIKYPAKYKGTVSEPIIVPHIWTVVDEAWADRATATSDHPLLVKGFLYEYVSNKRKNIGLQALAAYNKREKD